MTLKQAYELLFGQSNKNFTEANIKSYLNQKKLVKRYQDLLKQYTKESLNNQTIKYLYESYIKDLDSAYQILNNYLLGTPSKKDAFTIEYPKTLNNMTKYLERIKREYFENLSRAINIKRYTIITNLSNIINNYLYNFQNTQSISELFTIQKACLKARENLNNEYSQIVRKYEHFIAYLESLSLSQKITIDMLSDLSLDFDFLSKEYTILYQEITKDIENKINDDKYYDYILEWYNNSEDLNTNLHLTIKNIKQSLYKISNPDKLIINIITNIKTTYKEILDKKLKQNHENTEKLLSKITHEEEKNQIINISSNHNKNLENIYKELLNTCDNTIIKLTNLNNQEINIELLKSLEEEINNLCNNLNNYNLDINYPKVSESKEEIPPKTTIKSLYSNILNNIKTISQIKNITTKIGSPLECLTPSIILSNQKTQEEVINLDKEIQDLVTDLKKQTIDILYEYLICYEYTNNQEPILSKELNDLYTKNDESTINNCFNTLIKIYNNNIKNNPYIFTEEDTKNIKTTLINKIEPYLEEPKDLNTMSISKLYLLLENIKSTYGELKSPPKKVLE